MCVFSSRIGATEHTGASCVQWSTHTHTHRHAHRQKHAHEHADADVLCARYAFICLFAANSGSTGDGCCFCFRFICARPSEVRPSVCPCSALLSRVKASVWHSTAKRTPLLNTSIGTVRIRCDAGKSQHRCYRAQRCPLGGSTVRARPRNRTRHAQP